MRTARFLVSLTIVTVIVEVLAAMPPKVSDLPVSTSLVDYDANGLPHTLQSDGIVPYRHGTGGVLSFLMANGYNGITWGDWRLDLLASQPTRSIAISFCDPAQGTACPLNAVLPGNTGYMAPADPPWWGTQQTAVRITTKCSAHHKNMYTMRPGDRFTCASGIILPRVNNAFYELHMGWVNSFEPKPETEEAQVTCTSAASQGNCNAWVLTPVPMVNADGSTSPGRTRARLVRYVTNNRGTVQSSTHEGNFYLTYQIHVTQP